MRNAVSALPQRQAMLFIPESYATELADRLNALADMHCRMSGMAPRADRGALAISDTLMYQRDASPSDPHLSSLFGLALPLVKNGTALEMAQLERAAEPGYLDSSRLLLLTYEGQKPLSPEVHEAIAEWVRRGNALLLFGVGDSYNEVREWWNEDGMRYDRPQDHLTELLGLGRPKARLGKAVPAICL
jgi:hypothetical protein